MAYGTYALVYIGTSNTLDSRTVPAIALRESNNNGGHYFMSLKSGKRIHSNKWVEMPTTNLQTNCVHELAAMEGNDYWLGDMDDHENSSMTTSTIGTSSYSILNSDESNVDESDEQAINLRVQHAYQNLESDESTNEVDDSDITSESYSDSKDSTYIDDNDGDILSISTEINSNDFSFNIQNAYKLDTLANNDIHQEKIDSISILLMSGQI